MSRYISPLWLFLAILSCFVLFAQSVSGPSGTLAFRRGGDIWIKPLPDGAAVQMSQGGGAEYPEWSSSGQWLSFRQNGKLTVMPANGNRGERRVLDGSGVWSPMRDELAVADPDGLCVLSFDGNGQQKRVVLRRPKSGSIGDIAWSPDGNRLGVTVNAHLWRVNVDGTSAEELLTAGEHGSLEIRGWSSDGRHILVAVNGDSSASIASDGLPLTFVPADGGRPHTFASSVLHYPDSMSVSRDRAEVLVSAGCCREDWHNKRVALVDPATGSFTLLTSATAAAVSPSWSPEGDRIAYVSAPEPEARAISGTVVLPNGQISPRAANGKTVVDSVGGGEPARQALAKRRIWIMNADGKQMRQITSDPQYRDESPLWSRNGQYILSARLDRQDNASLWSINLNSGALQKVVDQVDGQLGWFGYYGHINWYASVAWHQE